MIPKIQNIQNIQKFQVNSSIFDPQIGVFLSPKSYLFMTSFFSNAIL